ncbi:MAG: outer membrane beta-barrel protein [Bacteroidetes bacterium]|nr:outer membrane beta-barrel protein [Bacteroidota bacterium]
MKRISIFLLFALTLVGMQSAHAQGLRVGDRAWYTVRGGLFVGVNQSFHKGSVPLLPSDENAFYAKGNSSNFIFGVHGEKALTRFVVLGVRLTFDQMSGMIDGRYTEPYRIADNQGTPWDVVRDHSVDYTLQYLSLGGYGKVYPMGGPGLFVSGGVNIGALMKHDYAHTATIVEPEWAVGSQAPEQSGVIDNVNGIRYAAAIGLGYDFFFRYGFLSPQVMYEFGLNQVVDAPYADSWKINNIRAVVDLTFPIP